MKEWLKGGKGVVVGMAMVVLSLFLNSQLGELMVRNPVLQVIGYVLLIVGCVLLLYAVLAQPKTSDQTSAAPTGSAPTDAADSSDTVPSDEAADNPQKTENENQPEAESASQTDV